MDDLIRRNDAIKALGERPMIWFESDYEFGARNQYDSDVHAIKTVQPVQQDITEKYDRLHPKADKNFNSCLDCVHSEDSEAICIMRRCIHAISELRECYKDRKNRRI